MTADRYGYGKLYPSHRMGALILVSMCVRGIKEKRTFTMKTNVKKLTAAAVLTALAVVGSMFSFPFLGAKCSPVQHMVNVIGGVLLGPWYSLGAAFVASLIRNMLGLGSPLAFPGSMCGAFLCGALYHWVFKKANGAVRLVSAFCGELFGTAVIGGMLAYPIAYLIMNNTAATLFGFVFPFFVSTAVGTVIAAVVVTAIKRTKALNNFFADDKDNSTKTAI